VSLAMRKKESFSVLSNLENAEKVAFLKNEQFYDDGKQHTNKFLWSTIFNFVFNFFIF
jgi:hypothetical protein